MSRDWVFDVASLMVLVGAPEEQRLRLIRRSLVEAFAAVPVAGIQNYLTSLERISDQSSFTYFSPYGRKTSPLKNMELDSAVTQLRLLENAKYTAYRINPREGGTGRHHKRYLMRRNMWAAFTWVCFAALMTLWALLPDTTWIGATNCVTLTGWSIILRVVEYFMIRRRKDVDPKVAGKDQLDAIFFLGQENSCLVIEGSRKDIKLWTSSRLIRREALTAHIPNMYWQQFTRIGTLMALVLVFSTVANGSTEDQLLFVSLFILGQLNVFICIRLNAKICIEELQLLKDEGRTIAYRTEMYGHLIRRFKELDQSWIVAAEMLPKTPIWEKWAEKVVVVDTSADLKDLYNDIAGEMGPRRPSRGNTQLS